MSFLKTEGIVLKEINTGEADKILVIFSNKAGKLSASAKGARRPKNSFAASSQFLCYSDFVLFKGKDMYSINSSDVIEPFYEIRNDVIKLTYAAYMVDLVMEVVQEDQQSNRLLKLLLNTLYFLSKTDKSPELITHIFEFRFITIAGYAPWTSGCSNCGSEDLNNLQFSFKTCGFLCRQCRQLDLYGINLSSGAAKTLNHIVTCSLKDLFSFEVSKEVLEELKYLSRRYIRERLEKDFSRLDYLDKIQKF